VDLDYWVEEGTDSGEVVVNQLIMAIGYGSEACRMDENYTLNNVTADSLYVIDK
jgi:hypothetical protein